MGSQVTGTQPLLLEAESLTEVSRLELGPSKTSGQNPSPKSISIFHPFFLCCKYFSQDTGCHDFLALLDVSSRSHWSTKSLRGFEISVLVGVASRRFGVENSSWDYSGITTNVTFL